MWALGVKGLNSPSTSSRSGWSLAENFDLGQRLIVLETYIILAQLRVALYRSNERTVGISELMFYEP